MTNRLIVQDSGRELLIDDLWQAPTYVGMLEGLPTREGNRRHIEWLMKERAKRDSGGPYLIPPVETPIDMQGERYPFGTPAKLPTITCAAQLRSSQPIAAEPVLNHSALVVIWFQADFAFPIDPEVLSRLKALDWDKHATDFEL